MAERSEEEKYVIISLSYFCGSDMIHKLIIQDSPENRERIPIFLKALKRADNSLDTKAINRIKKKMQSRYTLNQINALFQTDLFERLSPSGCTDSFVISIFQGPLNLEIFKEHLRTKTPSSKTFPLDTKYPEWDSMCDNVTRVYSG
jgi:hypothetical protein